MESTINRKEYRREIRDEDIYARKSVERMEPTTSNIRFFSKIVNVMFLLLDVLLIKYFGYIDTFEKIKTTINSGISLDEIKTSIQNIHQLKIFSIEKQSDHMEEDSHELFPQTEKNEGEIENEENTPVEEPISLLQQIKKEYRIQPPANGGITSPFGFRKSDNPSISSYHTGVDIAASKGSTIVAAHDGTVIQAGENGNYGISITIQNEKLITLYGHCDSICVKKGEKVKAGQTIGQVGMTGNATGPHLHFEVKYDGELVNPQELL